MYMVVSAKIFNITYDENPKILAPTETASVCCHLASPSLSVSLLPKSCAPLLSFAPLPYFTFFISYSFNLWCSIISFTFLLVSFLYNLHPVKAKKILNSFFHIYFYNINSTLWNLCYVVDIIWCRIVENIKLVWEKIPPQ